MATSFTFLPVVQWIPLQNPKWCILNVFSPLLFCFTCFSSVWKWIGSLCSNHCGWHDLIVKLTYEQTLHSSSGHDKSSSADFLLPVFISGLCFPLSSSRSLIFSTITRDPEREIYVIACPTLDLEERSWMKQLCGFVCICDQKTGLIMKSSVYYTVASLADLKHHADGIGNS